MRIAIVNQPWDISSPPSGSSLALWSYHVARRFAREAGCEVVVYEKPRPGAALEERIENVTYVRVPPQFADRVTGGLLRRTDRFRSPRRASFGHGMYSMAHARWVARDLAARGCDVQRCMSVTQTRAASPASRAPA